MILNVSLVDPPPVVHLGLPDVDRQFLRALQALGLIKLEGDDRHAILSVTRLPGTDVALFKTAQAHGLTNSVGVVTNGVSRPEYNDAGDTSIVSPNEFTCGILYTGDAVCGRWDFPADLIPPQGP